MMNPFRHLDGTTADHVIVHAFSTLAAGIGAGLAELPAADAQVLMSIQATMVLALSERYQVAMHRTAAAELVLTLGATMVGRKASRAITGRWPGAARVANAMTAAALTESIGWAAVTWFRREHTA